MLGLEQDLLAIGYTEDDVEAVPEGAKRGLGCRNPQAITGLKKGEMVLDLRRSRRL